MMISAVEEGAKMSNSIQIYFNEDGVACAYDDTHDITIHCESEEEHDRVFKILEYALVTTTWLGDYAPYKCTKCGFHVDSKTRYCPDCGRRATNYD